jgi:hypothetical protein
MSANAYPDLHTEFLIAALLRATDRERLLVQLMASIWDNILELPIQPRENLELEAAAIGPPAAEGHGPNH